ncbi:TPA: efflux RND transporter periplasmic adaptor subunit [Stenotrophomonas maltophilia]|uniref:efflux RND transporter periplasmic adaptor subunit n=1 Tax=Stenotrophomonas maltophilia TaxID=40324 RepID=UPI00130FB06D|nr:MULTISPECIES: efflux RND transporter periplasmic adaptor subunit [Stenotrophomonas]MCO7496894.1 efflux RND transporter periplasmic adaptor subunit [Stenotrophomonas maltophilia]
MGVTTRPLEMVQHLQGRTVAAMVSDVRPQVDGIVLARKFREGDQVSAGELLFQIDPTPYKAAVDNAQAALAQAQAALLSSKPQALRYRELVDLEAISRQEAEVAQATYQQNEAAVAMAEAALRQAKVNLERTQVRAPISGQVDASLVTPGALVTTGQAQPLATIRQMDPMLVDLTQSSVALLAFKRRFGGDDAAPEAQAPVKLTLEDGSAYVHVGALRFTGSSVDPTTGDVLLRAEFPNPEHLLLPGMFVRGTIAGGAPTDSILVPQSAIGRDARGRGLARVVDEQNRIQSKVVVTGSAHGNLWEIQSGLKTGDRLVLSGADGLTAGQVVQPVMMAPKLVVPRATPDGAERESP